MLLIGASGSLLAGEVVAPEIDSASAAGALVLLSGALLVIRQRKTQKKKALFTLE